MTIDSEHGLWTAHFPPQPEGGDYQVTVTCTSGCVNTTAAVIEHVVFGDVWLDARMGFRAVLVFVCR